MTLGNAFTGGSPVPTTGGGAVAGAMMLPPGIVVISTAEESGPNASGQYVLGRTITFQLASGDIGSVWLPYANLTTGNVVAAITPLAERIAQIYALSNPSP